jgi:4-carboxymuconolactone decarboxylase
MTDAQRRVAAATTGGPRGGVRGPFVALLHSPDLAGHIQQLGAYLRFDSAIPPELRELAIVVTARHADCEYAWQVHRALGIAAGLRDSLIDAIGQHRRPEDMTSDEALVHDVVTDLCQAKALEDARFQAARGRFGDRGMIDLIALCGYYATLALVLNVGRQPIPETTPRGPFRPAPWAERA